MSLGEERPDRILDPWNVAIVELGDFLMWFNGWSVSYVQQKGAKTG